MSAVSHSLHRARASPSRSFSSSLPLPLSSSSSSSSTVAAAAAGGRRMPGIIFSHLTRLLAKVSIISMMVSPLLSFVVGVDNGWHDSFALKFSLNASYHHTFLLLSPLPSISIATSSPPSPPSPPFPSAVSSLLWLLFLFLLVLVLTSPPPPPLLEPRVRGRGRGGGRGGGEEEGTYDDAVDHRLPFPPPLLL